MLKYNGESVEETMRLGLYGYEILVLLVTRVMDVTFTIFSVNPSYVEADHTPKESFRT
jgi:hypothetical protein